MVGIILTFVAIICTWLIIFNIANIERFNKPFFKSFVITGLIASAAFMTYMDGVNDTMKRLSNV